MGVDGRTRVLLVDANAAHLAVLSGRLASAGFEMFIALDVDLAAAVVGRLLLDAVVCDWLVGERRGVEFLSKVRAAQPVAARLMLAARTPVWDELGTFQVWVTKPCSADELVSALATAIGFKTEQIDEEPDTRTHRRFYGLRSLVEGRKNKQ